MPALRTAFALMLLLVLSACSDDDNPSDNNGNNNNDTFKNEVTATINGDSWTATSVVATRTAAGGIVALTLAAHGPNGSIIDFGIAFGSVKTHTIDGGAVQADFEYENKDYGDGTGTITITTLTEKGMKGSFTINGKTSDNENGTATGSFDVAF